MDKPINVASMLTKIDEVDELLLNGLNKLFYASKFLYYDEFTRNKYPDSENIYMTLIPGCLSITNIPAGFVCYHIDNKWLLHLSYMKFILEYDMFPASFINLPEIVNIKRSSGDIQKAYINPKCSIQISKNYNDLKISCNFNLDKNIEVVNEYSEHFKTVLFKDIIELNTIKDTIITFRVFDQDYINQFQNSIQKEAFNYYNSQIKEYFLIKIQKLITDYKLLISIRFENYEI